MFGEDVLGLIPSDRWFCRNIKGKALIKFVADKQFEEVAKRGIAFSYGFPNILAYDLHKKLMGYSDVVEISTMEKQVNSPWASNKKERPCET